MLKLQKTGRNADAKGRQLALLLINASLTGLSDEEDPQRLQGACRTMVNAVAMAETLEELFDKDFDFGGLFDGVSRWTAEAL